MLKRVFASQGLEQLVDLPTRGENTLDLILTDIHTSRFKVSDLEPIGKSDHFFLIADVALSLAREARTTRTVWNYAKAKHFRETNWDEILAASGSDGLLSALGRADAGESSNGPILPSTRSMACMAALVQMVESSRQRRALPLLNIKK